MSKFKTSIPVEIKAVLDALPPRSFVNGVSLEGETVVVQWENDDYRTPYTYPVEWEDPHTVPAGVKPISRNPPAQTSPGEMVSRQQTGLLSPSTTKAMEAARVTTAKKTAPIKK